MQLLSEIEAYKREIPKFEKEVDRLLDLGYDDKAKACFDTMSRMKVELRSKKHTLERVEKALDNYLKANAIIQEAKILEETQTLTAVDIYSVEEASEEINANIDEVDSTAEQLDSLMPNSSPVNDFQRYKEMKLAKESGLDLPVENDVKNLSNGEISMND